MTPIDVNELKGLKKFSTSQYGRVKGHIAYLKVTMYKLEAAARLFTLAGVISC